MFFFQHIIILYTNIERFLFADCTKELEKKKYKQEIETMINRWNTYRDEMNNLLGDLSPYINYKETIQKMVEEDNYILEEIFKHSSTNSHYENDSDYNSESEDAKYLLS